MKPYLAQILIALACTSTILAQGPLTPPPGADPGIGPVNALTAGGLPQATMKTLHQVEPRTAIAGGTSGVAISASGAYYLAENITVATGDGITINASNVTLDLNGFSITTSAAPAAGIGVRLGQGLRNVAIRNGNIGGDGLGGAFTGGVLYVVSGFPQPPSNLRVADLSVAAAEYGISTALPAATCHVERCMVTGGSAQGIRGGIVKDCVVEGGPIIGRIVKDCSVTTSGTSGIVADVVENCYATSAGTAIQAKCIVNSYGTGGGNHDVVSAGVAQNVWAEGGGGSGDAIDGKVVSNSYGKRANDLAGASTGDGVKSLIASNISGVASSGAGLNAAVSSGSHAVSENGTGLSGTVIAGCMATTTAGDKGISAAGGVVAFSSGKGSRYGIHANDVGALIGNLNPDPSISSVVTGSRGVNTFPLSYANNSGVAFAYPSGISSDVINTCNGSGNGLSAGVNGYNVSGSLGRSGAAVGIIGRNVSDCYSFGGEGSTTYAELINSSLAQGGIIGTNYNTKISTSAQ